MARALVLLLLLLVAACGDPHAQARDAAAAQAQSELAADPSAALRTAKAALAEHGADPRLELVAGLAHLQLHETSEAVTQAEAGLSADELPPDLRADLSWVRGAALMARYRELSSADDWRAANLALEHATTAGAHRVEAATALTFLQVLGNLGNDDRLLKYARLVLQLEPEGESAKQVRALLDSKGLKP
jgi:hypothetical protein